MTIAKVSLEALPGLGSASASSREAGKLSDKDALDAGVPSAERGKDGVDVEAEDRAESALCGGVAHDVGVCDACDDPCDPDDEDSSDLCGV